MSQGNEFNFTLTPIIHSKILSRWCRQFLLDVNQEQRLLQYLAICGVGVK